MNAGLENPVAAPEVPERRPGRRWVLLSVVIVALGVGVWMSAPAYDPRLTGEWQGKNGLVRVFHPDGRADVLQAGSRQPAFPGGPRFWQTQGNELIVGHRKTLTGRVKKWFHNAFMSSRTGVQIVGLNDSRYEILEVTDSRLQIRPIRPAPRPPLPVEVYERVATRR